jgi:hypothetical protein
MSTIPRVKFNSIYRGETNKEIVDQIKHMISNGIESEYESKNLRSKMLDNTKKIYYLYLDNRLLIYYKNSSSISVLAFYDNSDKVQNKKKMKKEICFEDLKTKKSYSDMIYIIKETVSNGLWTPNTINYKGGKFESKYFMDDGYVVAEELKDKIKIKYYNKIDWEK